MMKPLIFISHVHEHRNLGTAIQGEIGRLLLNGVDFFVSSDRVSIVGGDRWLDQIETALNNAAIVLVICSKDSILRPWVNFEAGGAWMAKKRVVPLCCGGLRPSDLPQPLASRQAYNIANSEDLTDLIALIAREANLTPPDFSASDLATKLTNALSTPPIDTEDRTDLRGPLFYPDKIRLELKLHGHDFFDDLYEHDSRDNARRRVDEEEERIKSELRAFLAMQFGPKAVPLKYHGIEFPLGSIWTRRGEDLRSSGHESHVWCEVTVEVDGKETSLLQEIRKKIGYVDKSTAVGFLYRGLLDLEGFAEDLFNRKVQIKRFGEHELAFGKLDEVGAEVLVSVDKKNVEVRILDYDLKEFDLNTVLGPVFNYLKLGDHLKPVTDQEPAN